MIKGKNTMKLILLYFLPFLETYLAYLPMFIDYFYFLV